MEHGRRAVDPLIEVRTVAETGSTNADVLALAAGAGEGLWLRAERQTAGRGRQGRRWVSPVGNLSASTLVRLRHDDPPAATLALVAGVALAEVVAATLPDAGGAAGASVGSALLYLKWPNDLLLDGAKLSGILLERAGEAIVIGFGVNVLHDPDLPDRPTTSLRAQGVAVEADEVLRALAERFADWLSTWRAKGFGAVRDRWLALAQPLGTSLSAHLPDGSVTTGRFGGLTTDGALVLRLADGGTRTIHAGDVFTP